MKLKFFKSEELDKNQKVTIHKTGKMGFTMDAAKKMELASMKSSDIGINEEDTNDTSLYLVLYEDINTGSFRVSKAGAYYYINTKILFDNLKIDYTKENITYDMSDIKIDDKIIYKLKKREGKKNIGESNASK